MAKMLEKCAIKWNEVYRSSETQYYCNLSFSFMWYAWGIWAWHFVLRAVTLRNVVMGALATPDSAEIIILARKCNRVTFSVKSLMEP